MLAASSRNIYPQFMCSRIPECVAALAQLLLDIIGPRGPATFIGGEGDNWRQPPLDPLIICGQVIRQQGNITTLQQMSWLQIQILEYQVCCLYFTSLDVSNLDRCLSTLQLHTKVSSAECNSTIPIWVQLNTCIYFYSYRMWCMTSTKEATGSNECLIWYFLFVCQKSCRPTCHSFINTVIKSCVKSTAAAVALLLQKYRVGRIW